MRRSIIYIDGFNFYYGLLRSSKYRSCKWLDFEKLFRKVRPDDDLQAVKYFTAYWPDDSGKRHQTYTAALSQSTCAEVIEGRYKRKTAQCRVQSCEHSGRRQFRTFEEKETDVNIALHILDDGYQDAMDTLVLVSADSDLVPALVMFKDRFPQKDVVVYIPGPKDRYNNALELRTVADRTRILPANLLPHCQLPSAVSGAAGKTYRKPPSW